jgi:hypothetical protein
MLPPCSPTQCHNLTAPHRTAPRCTLAGLHRRQAGRDHWQADTSAGGGTGGSGGAGVHPGSGSEAAGGAAGAGEGGAEPAHGHQDRDVCRRHQPHAGGWARGLSGREEVLPGRAIEDLGDAHLQPCTLWLIVLSGAVHRLSGELATSSVGCLGMSQACVGGCGSCVRQACMCARREEVVWGDGEVKSRLCVHERNVGTHAGRQAGRQAQIDR